MSKVGSRMMSRLEGSCLKRLLNEPNTSVFNTINKNIIVQILTECHVQLSTVMSENCFSGSDVVAQLVCMVFGLSLLSGFKFQMVWLSTPPEVNCMSLDIQRPIAELTAI